METNIEITIEKPRAKTQSNSPIEKDIFWYDIFYRKMRTFKCTKLDFKYISEKFVQFPDGSKKPLEETTQKEQSSYGVLSTNLLRPSPVTFYKKDSTIKADDSVSKFIDDYDTYNHSRIKIIDEEPSSLTVSIAKKELRDFTDELYRNRLEYEVLT